MPVLLRPPLRVTFDTRLFSGVFVVSSEKSADDIPRRDGVYGL
jgi:hypothetical protein